MPSEPCLIQGPCFDCDAYGMVRDSNGVRFCCCAYTDDGADDSQTKPTPKLSDDLRPNVPPRMIEHGK